MKQRSETHMMQHNGSLAQSQEIHGSNLIKFCAFFYLLLLLCHKGECSFSLQEFHQSLQPKRLKISY